MTNEPICAKCGHPIMEVDLSGTEFFRHSHGLKNVVWQHQDKKLNFTHQAEPVKYR